MRKIAIILLSTTSILLHAQTDNGTIGNDLTVIAPINSPNLQGREATKEEKEYAKQLAQDREQQRQIDYNLPIIDHNSQTITSTNLYAPAFYGYGLWRLHPGLNINLNASVFANLGKGYNHGVGFSQDVSAIYAQNLSPKLTLAIGGYINHLTYKGDNFYTGGINALIGYRINEHWSAYAFVQKAISSNNTDRLFGYRSPYIGSYGGYRFGPYDYGFGGMALGYGMMDTRFMDRIGGGVTYQWGKYNQNAISVSVEYDRLPSHRDTFYDTQRYSYPSRP